MDNVFSVGVSHKETDSITRSSFSLTPEKQLECYNLAKSHNFKDFIVLNTCNRTEIYGLGEVFLAENIFLKVTNQPKEVLENHKFIKTNEDAVSHIFRVASGLESQILGDNEILSQFKIACKSSKENGLLSPVFEKMVNTCIQASKEIKTNTEISKGTTSASYAIIEILKEKIGTTENKCLLIGTGKFGNKIAKNIKFYLPNYDVTVSNRTYSTALEVANEQGFKVLPYEKIKKELNNYDIIILSLSTDKYLIELEDITESKIKLILDLSIPQSINPNCKNSTIEILDIDTISKILDNSLEKRKLYLPVANKIIETHISSFVDWVNFYGKREEIISLKDSLIKMSKQCPHLKNIDESVREDLINKTMRSFVKNLKEDKNFKIDHQEVFSKFNKLLFSIS